MPKEEESPDPREKAEDGPWPLPRGPERGEGEGEGPEGSRSGGEEEYWVLPAVAEDSREFAKTGSKATASLVLGIIGLFATLCCCGGGMIGLACSIIAWVLGHQELRAIEAGESSPMGQGQARAGMIMGIVGTVLNGLIFIGAALYYIFVIALAAAGGA